MKPVIQLPTELAWILLWCLVCGAAAVYSGVGGSSAIHYLAFGVGAAHFVLFVGLLRLQRWAIGATIAYFGVCLSVGLVWFLWIESGFFHGIALLFCAWAICYLLADTTRGLFASAGGLRINVAGIAARLAFVSPAWLLILLLLVPDNIPRWSATLIAVTFAFLYFYLFEKHFLRFVAARCSPRPNDVSEEHWETFRQARSERLRGRLGRAKTLVQSLRPTRSARVLDGLLAMDRAKE
ncbi:MAG: hypothetical protein N2C14_03000, partial [Planctomycetales bacterium]